MSEPIHIMPVVTHSNRFSYQMFVILLLSCAINLLLGIKLYKQKIQYQQPTQVVEEVKPVADVVPKVVEQSSVADPEYLNLERLLLTQTNKNTQATSKLFGFKFTTFDPDWDCNNSGVKFTPEGVEVSCSQRQCTISQGLGGYSDAITALKSPECAQELAQREFTQNQLPTFTVNVKKFVLVGDQVFDTNAETPKGRAYKLEEIETNKYETGYSKQINITFYSPKKITDMLSDYGGEIYGSEDVYAKYTVSVGVFEDVDESLEVSQEKIIGLMEKMIDSIEFIEPIDLYK